MSNRGREFEARKAAKAAEARSRQTQLRRAALVFIGLSTIVITFILSTPRAQKPTTTASHQPSPSSSSGASTQPTRNGYFPGATQTLRDLAVLPEEELAKVDIALLNLRAAEGLPGADTIDIPASLAVLDRWAAHIKRETDRHLYRFRQHPERFQHSEPRYLMEMFITVLQEDFKIQYDPAIRNLPAEVIDTEKDPFYQDARNVFLNGPIERQLGTCSSLPVLYVALGRRLGYPLKLVSTNTHYFVRWEGTADTFNIEATTPGFLSHSDDHYRSWPKPVTPEQEANAGWLRSMTPRQELASFMSSRALVQLRTGHLAQAVDSQQIACHLHPESKQHLAQLDYSKKHFYETQIAQVHALLEARDRKQNEALLTSEKPQAKSP